MGMQLKLEDKTMDSNSQEGKNLLFCPPDEADKHKQEIERLLVDHGSLSCV